LSVFTLGCGTIYHSNYYVRKNTRFYYNIEHIDTNDGIPEVLEVGEHQFAETKLLVEFRLQMCLAWYVFLLPVSFSNPSARVSASNCTNIYQAKHDDVELPQGLQFSNVLSHRHVNEGFKILSLLEHARDTVNILSVPHTAKQGQRFDKAMEECNRFIKQEGQHEL
jgi:hypothetical protein